MEIGCVIIEMFEECGIDVMVVFVVLFYGYVLFIWGKDVKVVVVNSVVLEEVCKMNLYV